MQYTTVQSILCFKWHVTKLWWLKSLNEVRAVTNEKFCQTRLLSDELRLILVLSITTNLVYIQRSQKIQHGIGLLNERVTCSVVFFNFENIRSIWSNGGLNEWKLILKFSNHMNNIFSTFKKEYHKMVNNLKIFTKIFEQKRVTASKLSFNDKKLIHNFQFVLSVFGASLVLFLY
jgi:hypothetical protein